MKTKLWHSVCFVILTLSILMPRTVIADVATKEEAAKIEELIEQLASPNNPKSLVPRGQYLKFPPDWDHKAQGRVDDAATSLVKYGPSAIPQLIAHADDKRFSFISTSVNGAMSQMSVGDACRRIIEIQLDVFEQFGIYPRMYPTYFGSVVLDEDDPNGDHDASLTKWWGERKDKSLIELQIESFEWAIEQQTQLRDKWRAKKQDKDSLKTLTEIITENRNTLRKLRNTQRPIERNVHPLKVYEDK